MNNPKTPVETGHGHHHLTLRWRWYYFYFVLALFDLLVIAASLMVYHRTRTSYQSALTEIGSIDARQQWVADLRRTVLELNAPGNDVFETRQVAEQRARFDRGLRRLSELFEREKEFGTSLSRFREPIERMTAEERTIFDRFEAMTVVQDRDEQQRLMGEASISMAAMDRHQADAFEALSRHEDELLRQESRLLTGYASELARGATLEKWFLATVVLMLVGMFAYGRKLQHTHEHMILDQQRAIEERHARLAAVGEVCSAVAHGIRNPLAAITSSAQLALEIGGLDEVARQRFQDVLAEGRRLDRRVKRLLDFSRPTGQTFTHCNLREVVERAIHEVRTKLQEKGLRLVMELDDERLTVYGDAERLVQSVIELLSNSMDHTPTGGEIRVVCRRERSDTGRAEISVIDNGPGIPDHLRSRIFDLFVTSKTDGHGIGLASVKRAVELHGGDVSVVSGNPKGAHIKITLPLA